MRAYVDTSIVVAVALGEPNAKGHQRRLEQFDALFASNLLEAELRSVFQREEVELDRSLLSAIDWVLPDRPLSDEITRVQSAGYVRGADLWHLACALYLARSPEGLTFVTLDARQRRIAGSLGFEI